jgi:hypothetical protein
LAEYLTGGKRGPEAQILIIKLFDSVPDDVGDGAAVDQPKLTMPGRMTTHKVASKYASVSIVMPLGTSLNARCELGSGLTCDTGMRGGRPYVTLSQLACG